MQFAGNIEDFPVIDILQYIHASRKDGTLHLKSEHNCAEIYFQNGKIVRASCPEMQNLGDILLNENVISPDTLAEAVQFQSTTSSPAPLGQILENNRSITHENLRNALLLQVEEVIYDIVGWEDGDFKFEIVNGHGPGDFAFAPNDIIPPQESDTRALLRSAMHRLKNGASPCGLNKGLIL